MPQRVQTLRSSTKLQRPAGGSREAGEIYVNWPDRQIGVIDASKNPQDLVAVRFFSSTTDYVIGDFVVNAGFGYKAKVNITAGAFNPTQWDTITTGTGAEPPISAGTTSQYWRGDKSWQTLDKTAVGLANVDNTSDATKPISSATQAALNLKAPLASPTFTGTVIAPTPAPGTNNTTVATTAFVAGNYAPILDPFFAGDPRGPTPATSDNDSSLATTAYVKANLVSYAPLDSPVFTGNPVAPTPAPSDNDTSIATTAFVNTAIGNRPTDAPSDANSYGRKAGSWVDVTEEAPNDGVSYGRKSGAWVASVGGAVISDTPPPGPLTPGQLWYEADSGNTFLWYSDADGSQWVQQNVQPGIVSNPNAGLTAETRNRVVNPAMQVSQENGNTAGTTNAYYVADQWSMVFSTTGAVSAQRVQVTTPNGSINRCRITVTTADTSLAATEYLFFRQMIEGVRVADFRWGSASAKQVVLRFGFKAPAGTYSASLRGGSGRSYITNFTVGGGQANTDTEQSLIISGDTAGAWATDTSGAIELNIVVAAGANYQGATGWQAANVTATSANSNGLATLNNTFELYDVGLYMDPLNTGVAPRWTMPDEAQELAACRRYYYNPGYDGTATLAWLGSGIAWSATLVDVFQLFPVPMRVVPAISLSSTISVMGATGSSVTGSIASFSTATLIGVNARYATPSGFAAGQVCYGFYNPGTCKISVNARM